MVSYPRSLYYYTSKRDDREVQDKILELSNKRPMEGQDKLYMRIRNEGKIWNYKRIRRVYIMLGLNKRRKTKKRIPNRVKIPLIAPQESNQSWSMDFMHDVLENGRKIRILNVIDEYNRESLAIETHHSITSNLVVKILDELIREKGKPAQIRVDNGPEFISYNLSEWSDKHKIKIQHIQPGKPMQNGYMERFNRTYRESVLDAYLFENIHQIRILSEEFMNDYNYDRPHESLDGKSPTNYKLENKKNSNRGGYPPLLEKNNNTIFVENNPV